MKKQIYQAALLLFPASYSLNSDHVNPAGSLAVATVALRSVLSQLTRCQ